MPLVSRSARARLSVLALMFSSLWLGACAGSSASYAPEAAPAYYGGGAADTAQASPGAMPAEAMPAPAPPDMSPRTASVDESISTSGSSDDDSGFFGGGGDESPKAAGAAPPPVAPAARAPMGAPPAAAPKTAPPPQPATGKPTGQQAQPGKKTEGGTEQAAEKPVTPLLIYTGRVGMEVAEAKVIPTTIDKIIDLAESFGGYLASRSDGGVVVRVPSKHFRDAMTALEKIGDVKRRSVSAEDVSEEYHDLEVRLANLKAVQKRLQEFLARAANVNDALTVERELERVGQEIDRIEGRMRFLRARASFSTITVDVTAKVVQQVVANGPPPPPPPRAVDLPIDWLSRVGLEALLNLR